MSDDKFIVIETRLLWQRLTNLKPNSQHIVYIVAIGEKGPSIPSETLVAWTDPAQPAYVDVSHFRVQQSFFILNYIIL